MSKRIGRGRRRTPKPPPTETGSFQSPLARLLETPGLARVVPQLAPETLHHLIRHCGLDVCAEVVTLATPAQLASVFDLDLWRGALPGHDERFDTERFGEWLEHLVEAGDSVAARIVAAMDEHLVVAGLSRYVRVFDPGTFEPTESSDDEPMDRDQMMNSETSGDVLECEVGGYLVRGTTAGAWDAIVALLLALDADHHGCFHAVMSGCRRLSNSKPEVDGLDDLLLEPEQQFHDLAVDREHRRSQQGYSTPADARAFLLMARRPRRLSKGEPAVNPLVAAYFRAGDDPIASGDQAVPDVPRGALVDMLDTLSRAGLVPRRPRALLEGAHSPSSRLALIRRLIEYVRERDDALYLSRSHELAFLTNTLAAGCSIQSRAFTPQEASDAAVGVCNLGLEHWPARWPESAAPSTAGVGVTLPDTFLMDHDLVSAFEVGWTVLHEDVSMFAAGQLVVALSNLQCSDGDIQEGLDALRFELTKHSDAGTPWHARHALDVIGMLDMPAWASVVGLLDECPVIPAALTATLDGRRGAVSATEFEFIATRSQLARVREFMARFLDILGV